MITLPSMRSLKTLKSGELFYFCYADILRAAKGRRHLDGHRPLLSAHRGDSFRLLPPNYRLLPANHRLAPAYHRLLPAKHERDERRLLNSGLCCTTIAL